MPSKHDLWTRFYNDHSESMIKHAMNICGDTPNHGKVCFLGRSGTPHMCGWYAGHDAFFSHILRNPSPDRYNWMAGAVQHWAEQMVYSYFNGYKGNPKNHRRNPYNPPGEYVSQHGTPTQVFIDDDSHFTRHAGIYGICVALANDEIRKRINTAPVELVETICLLYGFWLTGYLPGGSPKLIEPYTTNMAKPSQGFAFALQARSLVGLYQLTGDYNYLVLAYYLYYFHFAEWNARIVTGSDNKTQFKFWDNGRNSYRMGGGITGLGGQGLHAKPVSAGYTSELTSRPWYIGDWVVSLYRLYKELEYHSKNTKKPPPEIPAAVDQIKRSIKDLTKIIAYDTRAKAPIGDLWRFDKVTYGKDPRNTARLVPRDWPDVKNFKGDQDLYNHMIQGGMKDSAGGSTWITKADVGKLLTPSDWEALEDDKDYWMPTALTWQVSDGLYWQWYWMDGDMSYRVHEQRRRHDSNPPPGNWPDGPHVNQLANCPSRICDAAYIRYLVLDEENPGKHTEDKLWAEWLIHDALAFQAGKGAAAKVKKNERKKVVQGGVKREGRSLTWVAQVGLVASENELSGGNLHAFHRNDYVRQGIAPQPLLV